MTPKFSMNLKLPNPAFERDAAEARLPSTLRWAMVSTPVVVLLLLTGNEGY
jgi:hypothetical protein